jgi:hypothetical protein
VVASSYGVGGSSVVKPSGERTGLFSGECDVEAAAASSARPQPDSSSAAAAIPDVRKNSRRRRYRAGSVTSRSGDSAKRFLRINTGDSPGLDLPYECAQGFGYAHKRKRGWRSLATPVPCFLIDLMRRAI